MPSIPLPPFESKPGATAHAYPFKIAIQTQEFIQGALFHATFADLAAGIAVAQPGGVDAVEEKIRELGLAEGVASQGWSLLQKYQAVFGGVVHQSVLITLCSHWDWFVRKLAAFILHGRNELNLEQLPREVLSIMEKPDRGSIKRQIEVICEAASIQSPLDETEVDALVEMSLVRNLGLHNRWEVDAFYVKRTQTMPPPIGGLRLVKVGELFAWHQLLIKVLGQLAEKCATRFAGVSEPPI